MIRGIGLRSATSINVITMIGIGPLITIPLVIANLHGSVALVAWIVGGVIALCDGLVYAELGSLYPGSGGTYVFLREAFGRNRWGRLLAFLFAWQVVLSTPLTIATGYIGFAHYAGYLWAPLAASALLQGIVAACVAIVTLVLLYRPINVIGAVGVALAGIAVATLAAIVVAAVPHLNLTRALSADPRIGWYAALAAGLGPSLVITLYDYSGYGQSCTISDEVRAPVRVLPASVIVSIVVVGLLYVALQLGVLGVIPWHELVASTTGGAPPDIANYVGSNLVERVWGAWPARVVTIAVLVTAFASTFGGLLGASRIPYAAAVDGVFLRPFARLHPRGRFPSVSLVVLGLLTIPPCFFSLGDVIGALTAGLTIVQPLGQIVALGALRARGVRAPYRMWLYPLPALIAFAGWTYIFISSGTSAIAYGLLTLGVGIIVYVWRARRSAEWPFGRKATTLACVALGIATIALHPSAAAAQTLDYGHSAIVEHDGAPVFEVDRKPFFVYGAAFFYERLPRATWRSSLFQLRYALGINTLDLYVPWNWHELADGNYDFGGRTNPRRDLREVLRLARVFDFKIILRPGPVVRNEWRNGGYPQWLLQRPEYGMPLRDVLEGRYPATATLQNAHSDVAAAQWMRNATHMTYAKRWLERVLREFAPVSDRVLAIALDDDQGAYIDNQTWPAPHLAAYLDWLRDTVHGVTGPRQLVFINTYEMKVTASSPVWAMGNWYQSDAYAIGEHDRAQLEFATGLLQTRPHQPLMLSEFQAGWLQQPQNVLPQPADPANTLLAMHTLLGIGVRGLINFPAQDTLDPAGWEAPFANAFYAWDAALGYDAATTANLGPADAAALQIPGALGRNPRLGPTAEVGDLVRTFGSQLANARVVADAGIVYLTSAYDPPTLTNADVAAVADATIAAQQACRNTGLTCELIDARYADARALARYPLLYVPSPALARTRGLPRIAADAVRRYERQGGTRLASFSRATVAAALRAARHRHAIDGAGPATYAQDARSGTGFVTLENYGDAPLAYAQPVVRRLGGTRVSLPPLIVAARSALLLPVDVPLHDYAAGFAAADVLESTSCPVRDLRPLPAAGRIEIVVSSGLACTLRMRIGGRSVTAALAAGAKRVIVTASGGTRSPALGVAPADAPARRPPRTLPVRSDLLVEELAPRSVARNAAIAYRSDVYRDGYPCVVLENDRVRIVVSPAAGGRAFVFEDKARERNAFDTVGALRDDVALAPPPSRSDRIARYTHQFPAGFFNRPYATTIEASGARAAVRLSYRAPDAYPHGGRFERLLTLEPQARSFTVDASATFEGDDIAALAQRGRTISSLSAGNARAAATQRILPADVPLAPKNAATSAAANPEHAIALFDTATHDLVMQAWDDRAAAEYVLHPHSIDTRVTLGRRRPTHLAFGYDVASSVADARERLRRFAQSVARSTQGARAPARSNGLAGKWRNGLRDRLKSG